MNSSPQNTGTLTTVLTHEVAAGKGLEYAEVDGEDELGGLREELLLDLLALLAPGLQQLSLQLLHPLLSLLLLARHFPFLLQLPLPGLLLLHLNLLLLLLVQVHVFYPETEGRKLKGQ